MRKFITLFIKLTMKLFKHYSFDLWKTLIKSAPDYKQKRNLYFFEHFNQKKKTIEEVSAIIREVEKMVDHVMQTTGYQIHSIQMVSMILFKLEYENKYLKTDDMIAIVHMMQQHFLDCPAELYDKDTYGVLHYLHSEGSVISLLSNTAFILGSTLDQILKKLEIDKYISFSLYSDEVGLAKPNPKIFEILINNSKNKYGYDKKDIIHIGDNEIADIHGAKNAGISYFQINTNEKSIKDLFI